MSYILEALRRADSERDRGGVPGINARPLPTELSEAPRSGLLVHPLAWLCGALAVLLLLGLLAWQWMRDEPTAVAARVAPPPVPAAPPAIVAPAPAPAPAVMAAPAATTAATPHSAADDAARAAPVVVPPAARELLAAEEAASRQRAARSVAPASAAPTPVAAPAPAATTTPPPVSTAPREAARPAAPPPQAASAEAAIGSLRDLPEDVRRAIPALAIGGSVYSANPAGRFVVVNGQILHEGDRLGPDLTLEQIRLKSAVLRYRSYRFEIDY